MVTRCAKHGSAPAKLCEAPPSLTRPLSSRNDFFLLDFACIFVYLPARVQAITPAAMVWALWQAVIHMYALMARACTQGDPSQWTRTTATHGDMRPSDAIICSP